MRARDVTLCGRCRRNILDVGGGCQVRPGVFVCWDCERPGEDLTELAEKMEEERDADDA